MNRLIWAASLAFLATSATADAGVVSVSLSGNDCSTWGANNYCYASPTGTFNDSDGSLPLDGSPFVIKFDDGLDGVEDVNNILFPSLDGTEFEFAFTTNDEGEIVAGSWSYSPDGDDPSIQFWTAKAGNGYTLYYEVDGSGNVIPVLGGEFATPINPANGKPFGLSHLSLYDTLVTAQLPEPATLFLFGAAAAAGAFRLRRRTVR